MLRHGTQLGGSQRLGKRAWPERRRPAVAATTVGPAVVWCTLQQSCSSGCSAVLQCPGALFPSGPVPRLLVAWTTASDRLKKDPGRAPQHDRGRHWPAVEATGPHLQAITNQALYYRATEALAMTTCTSVSLHTHTAGKTHIYVLARLHPEHSCSFFPSQASIWKLPPSPHPQPQPATLDSSLLSASSVRLLLACLSVSVSVSPPLTLTSRASPWDVGYWLLALCFFQLN